MYGLDDVPELTDAVEEIEAPSILELPADEDEPSQWLEIDRGEVSVTGPAPDSVFALPTAMPQPEAGEDMPPSEFATSQAMTPVAAPDPGSAAALAAAYLAGTLTSGKPGSVAADAPRGGAGEIANEFVVDIDGAGGTVLETGAATTGEFVRYTPPEATVERGEEPVEEAPPVAADELPAPVYTVEALENPVLPAAPEEAAPPSIATPTAEPVSVVATPGDTIAASPDALHWDVLAEEIRMQVLQRIDIFTDTGLQEQLAARLQPIVDRASADLVATINREVGRLLRTYVAEAIEREIEKWRQEGG